MFLLLFSLSKRAKKGPHKSKKQTSVPLFILTLRSLSQTTQSWRTGTQLPHLPQPPRKGAHRPNHHTTSHRVPSNVPPLPPPLLQILLLPRPRPGPRRRSDHIRIFLPPGSPARLAIPPPPTHPRLGRRRSPLLGTEAARPGTETGQGTGGGVGAAEMVV